MLDSPSSHMASDVGREYVECVRSLEMSTRSKRSPLLVALLGTLAHMRDFLITTGESEHVPTAVLSVNVPTAYSLRCEWRIRVEQKRQTYTWATRIALRKDTSAIRVKSHTAYMSSIVSCEVIAQVQ